VKSLVRCTLEDGAIKQIMAPDGKDVEFGYELREIACVELDGIADPW